MANLLLCHGASPNTYPCDTGNRPPLLLWAVLEGHIQFLRLLLKHEANTEAKVLKNPPPFREYVKSRIRTRTLYCDVGDTALIAAAGNGNLKSALLLILYGADISYVNTDNPNRRNRSFFTLADERTESEWRTFVAAIRSLQQERDSIKFLAGLRRLAETHQVEHSLPPANEPPSLLALSFAAVQSSPVLSDQLRKHAVWKNLQNRMECLIWKNKPMSEMDKVYQAAKQNSSFVKAKPHMASSLVYLLEHDLSLQNPKNYEKLSQALLDTFERLVYQWVY